MDLQLLRAFVTVAREGNLTRAADRLCITQPGLSLQLRRLQDALGFPLLERTSHGMRLTDAGRRLLPSAERALAAAAEFDSTAASLAGTVTGRLHIGTIVDPEFLRLGAFLKRLVERYPGLATDLSHGMSGTGMRDVEDGRLDVAYTLGSPGLGELAERFHVLPLTLFNYCVIAPAGWAGRLRNRNWRELAAQPWIGTPPESVHNRLLSGVFKAHGVAPNIVAHVDLEPSMLDLVKSGVGLSLARDDVALRAAHAGGVTIAEGVALSAALGFICLRNRLQEPAIAAAFEVIGEIWQS